MSRRPLFIFGQLFRRLSFVADLRIELRETAPSNLPLYSAVKLSGSTAACANWPCVYVYKCTCVYVCARAGAANHGFPRVWKKRLD